MLRPDLGVERSFSLPRVCLGILSLLEKDDQKLAKIRSMLLEDRKTANTFYFQREERKDADVSKSIPISTFIETQTDH